MAMVTEGGRGYYDSWLRSILALTLSGLPFTGHCQVVGDRGPLIYAQTAPGVMLIRAAGVKANGTMAAEVGTGFVISKDGYLLTASHVIPDNKQYTSLIIGGSFGPATANATPYQLKLVARSDSYDAALLQIVPPYPALTTLSLRKSRAKVGEVLFVLGYPLGLPDTHFLDGRVGDTTDDAITTNALVDRGNSGGPVLDAQGCVIGIVYGEITSREGTPVNGVKFAVPVVSLGDLIPKNLGPTEQGQGQSSDAMIIHVSDVLSREQTDHGFKETFRSYHDVIHAREGFVIDAVEAVSHNSLNPPELQFPTPIISADQKTMSFDYSLSSGPIFDQRRGWIDMTIQTRQRRLDAIPTLIPIACE